MALQAVLHTVTLIPEAMVSTDDVGSQLIKRDSDRGIQSVHASSDDRNLRRMYVLSRHRLSPLAPRHVQGNPRQAPRIPRLNDRPQPQRPVQTTQADSFSNPSATWCRRQLLRTVACSRRTVPPYRYGY